MGEERCSSTHSYPQPYKEVSGHPRSQTALPPGKGPSGVRGPQGLSPECSAEGKNLFTLPEFEQFLARRIVIGQIVTVNCPALVCTVSP